jgi:glycosyltransferase involved in cell wall biosynthesis
LSFGIDLCVSNPEYKGGVGRYSLSITQALIKQSKLYGLDFKILCSKKNREFLKSHFELGSDKMVVHKLYGTNLYQRLHSLSYLLNNQKIFNLVRMLINLSSRKLVRNLNIVYTPTTYLNLGGNVPSLVSLHDTQETEIPENFTRKQHIYRKLNRIYTLEKSFAIQFSSDFIKREVVKNLESSSPTFRAIVIPEGVDVKLFKPEKKIDPQICGLVILMVANFHRHKGHIFLMEALSELHLEDKIKIVFVGEGDTLDESRALAEQISSRHLNFEFTGKINDEILLQWYREAHLVISASDYESSSLPILEGLAMGCAILASDIPAHKEMSQVLPIELYERNSKISFQEKLYEIINDVENRFSLHEILNRNQCIQAFSWDNIANQYLEFICRVAKK